MPQALPDPWSWHFIEVRLDEDGRVWLMLHSGCRNVGKVLAEVHIASLK